jgi:tetratricopeptide (TPR) repeat protein
MPSSNKHKRSGNNIAIQPQHKKWVMALMFVCVLVIFFALKLGLSDIYAYQAKRYVLRWETTGAIKQEKDIAKALNYITKARSLEPNVPNYAEIEAQILIWQFYQQRLNLPPEQQKALLQQALSLYQQALFYRPSWPFAWLGVVDTKVLLGEFDQELNQAIERSITLGGFEAPIQFGLINITFNHLNRFDSETRKTLLAMYTRALQGSVNIKELIELGEDKGIFILQCLQPNLGEYHRMVQKRCEKLLP